MVKAITARPASEPAHSPSDYKSRAQIAKALAHPARLMLVEVLSQGDRCVCDLTELVGVDQSTVSKHLSILKSAGIVDDLREGAKVFYHLRAPCVLKIFECIEGVLDLRLESESRWRRGRRGVR
ncbi:MAG: winged helix-turn-helix transcriptional regulator [Candidatus Riflebacteria bacterium]|nr:winged helix-turn-helix transcriptional regulator [Candidatus Riflebacteria bacterium]